MFFFIQLYIPLLLLNPIIYVIFSFYLYDSLISSLFNYLYKFYFLFFPARKFSFLLRNVTSMIRIIGSFQIYNSVYKFFKIFFSTFILYIDVRFLDLFFGFYQYICFPVVNAFYYFNLFVSGIRLFF